MKIRISFTLDIDPDAWALEYGIAKSEVREDVQTYISESTHSEMSGRGLTVDGEGRRDADQ